MNHFKNIKIEHKILTFLFLFTFIVFIYFHYHFKEGLFFDQPSMFSSVISRQNENLSNYFIFLDDRIRFFNNFLVSIPFNILFFLYNIIFHKVNMVNYLCLFTSSYFIVHIFALIINFLVAVRTKRYDIAILGFIFYTFFSLTNAIWAVRELHITILFYFALLSYFLSSAKLEKKDFIPIFLLIIYLFESFEIDIIYGFILQLFACLYTILRKDENIVFKNIIGTGCFFASIYIFLKMFLWLPIVTNNQQVVDNAIDQYIFGITFYTQNVLHTGGTISIAGIILIISMLFYKKRLNIKSIIPLVLFGLISGFIIWKLNNFHADCPVELNAYGWTIIIIFPFILSILICDYLKIDILKYNKNFYTNAYTIACIIGILQLLWQIHTCFEFNQYVTYIKDKIKNSDKHIIEITEEEYNNNKCLNFYTSYGIIHQSLLLNPDNNVYKIIIPVSFKAEESDWKANDRTYFQDDLTVIHDAHYKNIHSKYINTLPIVEYLQEYKQDNPN